MTETLPVNDVKRWPKTYLLQLYTETIEAGCLRVHPIDEAAAKSLTQAFYRFRRKVDKSMDAYIQPEFQLVTATSWRPEFGGCFYLIYNTLPDNEALPGFTPISLDEATTIFQPTPLPSHETLVLDVGEINVADFVKSLRSENADKSPPPASDETAPDLG